MTQLLLTVLVFVVVVAAMAVGVIMGRKPISGSCGGLNNLGMKGNCEICGKDPARCERGDG